MGFVERWRHRFVRHAYGISARLGDGGRLVECAAAMGPRGAASWALPGLGGLFALGLLVVWWLDPMAMFGDSGFGRMTYRVFVFDYALFCFGLVSGLGMARRWRSNAEQVEELSLAPVLPGVVSRMMMAGPCSVWLRVLLLLAAIEMGAPVVLLGEASRFAEGASPGHAALAWALAGLAAVAIPLCFAWFHYESIRLAHAMMVVHALPKVSLLRAGAVGFVEMTVLVVAISLLGSGATGLVFFAVWAAVSAASWGTIDGDSVIVWGLASCAGAMLAALMKASLAEGYHKAFVRRWLLYQWWGAGERWQPREYPSAFHQRLPLWSAWIGAQEEENAGVDPRRRVAARRYERMAWTAHRARAAAQDLPSGGRYLR